MNIVTGGGTSSAPDGILIDGSGNIVAVCHGYGGTPPAGQTFVPMSVAGMVKGQAAPTALSAFIASAKAALDLSDTTMHRIVEAVSLGLTTWTTADVVAWVTYRRALRSLLTASSVTTLPARPAYPVGT